MKERIRRLYEKSSLADKIRYSYFLLLIPTGVLVLICLYYLWNVNFKYRDMFNTISVASEFSLDFKNDFDYETYLLIVENKSIEESKLGDMIDDANRIVDGLVNLAGTKENSEGLKSLKKYIINLSTYKERIENNLREGNKYEKNLDIWENDVQIVTTLLKEAIAKYTYNEIKDIQHVREKYQERFMSIAWILLVAIVISIVIVIFLSYYLPQSITRPITEQIKKEQIRLRKAEFELLQSQINPHFLYNTLDAIVWLAESGERNKVVNTVESLSDFFRISLNQGKDIVSIEEELQHVRSYLEIQQVRYLDILQFDIDVSETMYGYLIPKITIQPLVENALYHGIKNKRGMGHISIFGEVNDDYIKIVINDNGIGMTEERLKQVCDGIKNYVPSETNIYGLYNVNERIKLNFGEGYGISIESIYKVGTSVTITLPLYVEG